MKIVDVQSEFDRGDFKTVSFDRPEIHPGYTDIQEQQFWIRDTTNDTLCYLELFHSVEIRQFSVWEGTRQNSYFASVSQRGRSWWLAKSWS